MCALGPTLGGKLADRKIAGFEVESAAVVNQVDIRTACMGDVNCEASSTVMWDRADERRGSW